MKLGRLISSALLLYFLTACQKAFPVSADLLPMNFSQPEVKSGLSSYYNDFSVWSSCISGGSVTIMDGYRVNYDLSGWSYTEGEGTEGQELKFWNGSADQFRFHAGAPVSAVSQISESSLTLNLSATDKLDGVALYSRPYMVRRTDPLYGNTVNLRFRYANARLNLSFTCESDKDLIISDITLIPASSYATSGTLRIDYDWNLSEAVSGDLEIRLRSSEPMVFPDVKVPGSSDSSYETSSPWYVLPDAGVTGRWKVRLVIDGIQHQAEFTIDKAWEPGKSYIYKFQYTDKANLMFIGTDTELFVGENLVDGGEHNFS